MKNIFLRIFFAFNFLICVSHSQSFVECDFKLIQWEGKLVEKCEVLSLHFSALVEGDFNLDSANGTHIEGFTDDDVTTFIIKFASLEKIPQGVTNFFKNLLELEISNSGLKSVDGEEFRDFKNLSSLNLSGNLLTKLSSGLFIFTPNLEYIDFSFNRLKYIDADIFDDLPLLNRAFFMSNICTGEERVFGNDRNEVQYFVEKFLLENCRPKAEE